MFHTRLNANISHVILPDIRWRRSCLSSPSTSTLCSFVRRSSSKSAISFSNWVLVRRSAASRSVLSVSLHVDVIVVTATSWSDVNRFSKSEKRREYRLSIEAASVNRERCEDRRERKKRSKEWIKIDKDMFSQSRKHYFLVDCHDVHLFLNGLARLEQARKESNMRLYTLVLLWNLLWNHFIPSELEIWNVLYCW